MYKCKKILTSELREYANEEKTSWKITHMSSYHT